MAKKTKGSEYRYNLKDSLKRIGGEYVQTHMPAMSTLMTSTQAIVNSFKLSTLKDKNRIGHGLKASRIAVKQYVGTSYSNLKTNIKSGKFYSEDLVQEDSAIGNAMADYGGDGIEEAPSAASFAQGLGTPSTVLMSGFRDTGTVITSSVDYLSSLLTANNTSASIAGLRYHTEQMNALKNIQNLNEAQLHFMTNEVNGYIQSSLDYYNESINTLHEIKDTLSDIKKASDERYGKNSGTSKIHDLEKVFGSDGANLLEYISGVKSKVKDGAGMLSFFKDGLKMSADDFKNNPMAAILRLTLNLGTSKATKKSMSNLNEALSGGFASYLMGMNKMKKSKNPILSYLGNLLGVDLSTGLKVNTASYKNEALTKEVENKKNKAITEVIPQYLSEITRAISGIDKVYDYSKGVFVDRSKRNKDLAKDERQTVSGTMMESRQYMSDNLYKIEDNMTANQKKLYQDDLDAFMYFLAVSGENIDPNKLKYEDAKKRGLDLIGGRQSFTMMMALYKSLTKNQKARIRKEQLSAMTQVRSYRQMTDRELNFSGGIGAYNQFYDGTSVGRKPPISKAGTAVHQQTVSADQVKTMADEGMTIDEIIDAIGKSKKGSRTQTKEDAEKTVYEYAAEKAKEKTAGISGWFKKTFDIKNHKILNSLFGDQGFFPGVINNTADFISSIIYGDDASKEKGIFGELFAQVKDKVKQVTKDIKTWLKGKLGESKLWKTIFGDPKGKTKEEKQGWMGGLKETIADPVRSWFKTSLIPKLSKFYNDHLKSKVDNLHSKAEKYRAKAGAGVADFFSGDMNTTAGGMYVPKDKPAESQAESSVSSSVEEILETIAPPEIQKVQIVSGQSGLPVWVTFDGTDTRGTTLNTRNIQEKFTSALQRNQASGNIENAAQASVQTIIDQIKGGNIPGHRRGGRTRGGLAVVGEKGPEVAMLPGGTNIVPTNKSISVRIDGLGDNAQDFFAEFGAFMATAGSKAKAKKPFISKAMNKARGFIGGKSKPGQSTALTTRNVNWEYGKQDDEAGEPIDLGKIFAGTGKKKLGFMDRMKSSVGGNAAAGAMVSSMLGLGSLPGILVGALIGKKKRKKLESQNGEAAQQGKAVDEAQTQSKWQAFKSKFKGGAVGGLVSTMLGLGPLPGIIVGSLIANKRKKKLADKQAKKDGEVVDKEREKQGGLKSKLKRFKGAAIGGVVSTMLGLGPLPGIIVGSLISSKKKKKDIKDAEKQGDQVGNEQKKNGGGKLKNLFKKFKGAATGAVISTMLGLGPLPGIIVGSLLAKKKIKKTEEDEARKQGEAVDKEQQEQAKKGGFFSRLKDKAKAFGSSIKDRFTGFFNKSKGAGTQEALPQPQVAGLLPAPSTSSNSTNARDALQAKQASIDAGAKKRKERSAARQTQAATKKLLRTAKQGDGSGVMKNVETSMMTADTSSELGSVNESTSIMANAASIAGKAVTSGGDAGEGATSTTNGLLGGIMALLGGASIGSVIKNIGGGFLKKFVKKFVKNNAADAFAFGQVARGGSLIKGGISRMTAEGADTVDENIGSGEVARGVASTAAGGFKIAGKVAGVATGVAKPTGILGKLTQWITKLVKGIGKKAAGKAGKAGAATITKSAGSIAGKVIGKAGGKLVAKAATFLAKYGQPIGWAITIAQAVWDFGTGFADVRNIMGTSSDYDAPTSLKIVCGLAKALSNFLLGLIPVKWLASLIYGLIGKKEDKEALEKSQSDAKAKYDQFVKEHPEAVEKGLTEEKFNEIENKSTWTKIKEGVAGWFGKKKSSLDDYTDSSSTTNITIINGEDAGGGARGSYNGRGLSKNVIANILGNTSNMIASMGKKRRSIARTTIEKDEAAGRGIFSKIASTVKSWFTKDKGSSDSSSNSSSSGSSGGSETSVTQIRNGNVPYYSQQDPAWKDHKFGYYNGYQDTVGAGGCGPTTAAMMFQGLTGIQQSPMELADLANKQGYKNNGTSSEFFKYLGEQYGIPIEAQKTLDGDAVNKLKHNVPVALIGKNKDGEPPFGPGNHYLLATSAKYGNVAIYDPLDPNNNKTYQMSQLGEDVKSALVPQVNTDGTPNTEGSGRRASVNIPTEFARGALISKVGNSSKAKVESARANIANYSNGRGGEDTAITTLSKIANEMLTVLTTISDNVVTIGKNVVSASQSSVVSGGTGSSNGSGTSYSAMTDSKSKSTKYAKVVTP